VVTNKLKPQQESKACFEFSGCGFDFQSGTLWVAQRQSHRGHKTKEYLYSERSFAY